MATNFSKGLSVYGIPILPNTDDQVTGDVFFVDNGNVDGANDAGTAGSKNKPFITIDYANNQCAANNGDVIYVLQGHTETLNSTGALVLDVAGVSIIGKGWGGARPIISMSTSGSNETRVGITGANVRISNITFRANSTAIGSSSVGIAINADDVVIDNCRFDHSSTLTYFATTIEILTGADRTLIAGNEFFNKGTTAQSDRAINFSGTGGYIGNKIVSNHFVGNWSGPGVIMGSTDALCYGIEIADNDINNASTIATDRLIYLPSSANINGGSAGFIHNNFCNSGSSGSSTQLFVAPYFRGEGNYAANSTGIKMLNFLA